MESLRNEGFVSPPKGFNGKYRLSMKDAQKDGCEFCSTQLKLHTALQDGDQIFQCQGCGRRHWFDGDGKRRKLQEHRMFM